MISKLRIGTRSSALAMYQADLVRTKLKAAFPLIEIELIKIKTAGDVASKGKIAAIGRGIFTREIEAALLAGTIDMAVHSAKDMETELPEGLVIAAILEREDFRDCLVTKGKVGLKQLKKGALIGTSSLRRRAQLLHMRRDLAIQDLRGNVKTRLLKVEEGTLAGTVLAVAGLNRLGLSSLISETFEPSVFLPQAGQGAIAVEVHFDNKKLRTMMKAINHPKTYEQVMVERRFLRALNGGCQIPAGIHARLEGDKLHLEGAIFSPDGAQAIRQKLSGTRRQANTLPLRLARNILKQGGEEILRTIRKIGT